MKTKIQMVAVCLLSLVFVVSCSKYGDDDMYFENALQSQKLTQSSSEYQTMGTSSVTYGVTPNVGSFTPSSSSSVTLPGTGGCGSFLGGVLKAKVKSQSGSSFVVEISKQDGTPFSTTGTAYIKASSVCGSSAGSVSIVSGSPTAIDISITATFAQGVTHFYPVFISNTGGRYYAEPLMVYTIPTYTMSYTNGTVMGTVDGVEVRSSGAGNQNSSSAYQCTEFCKRYYNTVYGLSFSGWGDAWEWFGNLDTRFDKYANNGSVAPRVGDILCMSGSGLGHVAIITEVSSTQVKLAQQNSGTSWLPIGGNVSRSGNNLIVSDYTVQGWLRKKS